MTPKCTSVSSFLPEAHGRLLRRNEPASSGTFNFTPYVAAAWVKVASCLTHPPIWCHYFFQSCILLWQSYITKQNIYMITSLLSDPLTYVEGFLNNLPLTYFMPFFSDRATRKYLPSLPYLPLSQRFSTRGQFHYPGDIWQCLEVFLIVRIWGATGI